MSKNQKSLGDAIQEFVKHLQWTDKFLELDVKRIWKEKFGVAFSSRTEKLIFKNGELQLFLTSSPLKDEVMMAREAIAAKINQELGKEVVKKVIVR
jgi:hypothetical protein